MHAPVPNLPLNSRTWKWDKCTTVGEENRIIELLRCCKIFATALSISTFLLLKNCFAEDVALCVRANATFTTQRTVVLELVNCKLSLMVSSVNLHLSNIRRVYIEKNGTYFKFLTLIVLRYYHNPFGNERKFLSAPLLYCLDILTSIKHNPVTCVLTLITLFAQQLLAGHISLAGSEKEEVSKETVHLLLICYKLKLNKQTTKQPKKKRTRTKRIC